jgi:surface polysaccharide O-acyltransferase-like enzyme
LGDFIQDSEITWQLSEILADFLVEYLIIPILHNILNLSKVRMIFWQIFIIVSLFMKAKKAYLETVKRYLESAKKHLSLGIDIQEVN